MPVFEIYDDKVIFSDGKKGAVLKDEHSCWYPFSFFDNGGFDITLESFTTAYEAFSKAKEIYT